MSSVPETISYAKQITVEEYNQQKDDYTQKALKELNAQMKTFKTSEKSIIHSNKKISLSLPNSDNDDNDNNNDKDNDNDNNKDNDNDSDSDYEDKKDITDTINTTNTTNTTKSNSSLNFIIKHYVSEQQPPQQQLLKKRKTTNTNSKTVQPIQPVQQSSTMSDAIYAQHELDMETITKLKLKYNNLKNETDDLDSKKHFLTLELSNAQCDINDLKKKISLLTNENINLIKYIKVMKRHDDLFDFYIKIVAYIIIFLILLIIYSLL